MNWIKVEDQLPPVDRETGESEYVFVYPGRRCFPQIAGYSNGLWSNEGWHPANDFGATIPVYKGRGKKRHLSFTHWAYIELPKDDTNNVPMATMDEQEQPEADLEKEIEDYWEKICDNEFGELLPRERETAWFDNIARHFYELGLNARKEE